MRIEQPCASFETMTLSCTCDRKYRCGGQLSRWARADVAIASREPPRAPRSVRASSPRRRRENRPRRRRGVAQDRVCRAVASRAAVAGGSRSIPCGQRRACRGSSALWAGPSKKGCSRGTLERWTRARSGGGAAPLDAGQGPEEGCLGCGGCHDRVRVDDASTVGAARAVGGSRSESCGCENSGRESPQTREFLGERRCGRGSHDVCRELCAPRCRWGH